MDIHEQKNELRRLIRTRKSHFAIEELRQKSALIFTQIEKKSYFLDAQTIFAYWSMDGEVNTHDFILKWAKKKQFILPVVRGNELELRFFDGIQSLKQGSSFGIMEPTGKIVNDLTGIDLIIVPGIAFDKAGNRLGRGKAYYDKTLSNCNALKLGVCFDFQLIENIPIEPHDIIMNEVIFA